jgi:RND family efflux transporter MFP subunit
VQVVTPQWQDLAQTSRLPGTVAPWYQTSLYAKVPGYLKWIGFDKGDWVKEGTVLAVIDAPEIQQQYEQAKSDYAIKKLTFERLSRVWQKNPDVIAKQDVDVAEAAANGAKHVLEQRAAMRDYTKVRAPFSGIITARFVDPGAMIQVATNSETQASPLFTLMDMAKVRVYFNVPQEEAAQAKLGCAVKVRLRQYSERQFSGTLTRTTGVLDAATRTMLAEADLSNPEHLLQPGSFAEVEVSLKQHPHALLIPPAALVVEETGRAVFIVENGRARQVPVKTGLDDGIGIEITEGLKGTEHVVVVGQNHLKDGMLVSTTAYNLPAGQLASQHY